MVIFENVIKTLVQSVGQNVESEELINIQDILLHFVVYQRQKDLEGV